ncbi:MAG: hypothetical protein A2017_03265 [Lentisphaerae bacterium GWF2_44_16]|nr:MAG: hypothetical protein A2017_03265 [Lentisphaerae bacterium GWF2_44_16]
MNRKQNSLGKKRKTKRLALEGIIVFIAALFIFSIMTNRDPEEKKEEHIKNSVLSLVNKEGETASDIAQEGIDNLICKKNRKISEEQLKEINMQMNNISPETRTRLVKDIIQTRIEKLRTKIENMTQEEKEQLLEETLGKVRDSFNNMDEREKGKLREHMKSEAGKQDVKEALKFYHDKFSSQERQKADPVMYEIVKNLNAI